MSVARSLGRAGVTVHALGTSRADPVAYSRYCSTFVDVGERETQAAWLRWLEERGGPAVVLPCSDAALELVVQKRKRLEGLGYVLIEADDEVVLAMLDKERTYELARSCGVRTPKTARLEAKDTDEIAEAIGFPCAIKPRHAHRFSSHFGGAKVLLAANELELRNAVQAVAAHGLEAVATEIVPGDDDRLVSYLAYVDENGEPLAQFTKRKLRQFPPHFGVGSYHVSVHDAEAEALGLQFFRGVGLRGLAYVEFKRDARDEGLTLIECNHRFGAGLALAPAAGIDLALFTYLRLTGEEPAHGQAYRDGVHLWHSIDDARSFLALRRSGELTLLAWVKSLLHRQHFAVFRLDDPRPTLSNLHRLKRRLTGRRQHPL